MNKTLKLSEIPLITQRGMLPRCGLPSCDLHAFVTTEQVYVTGEAHKVHLCMGHAMQLAAKKDG